MNFFWNGDFIISEDMDHTIVLANSHERMYFLRKGLSVSDMDVICSTALSQEYAEYCYHSVALAIPEYRAIKKQTLFGLVRNMVKLYEKAQEISFEAEPLY